MASSSNIPEVKYDVFLSFRGQDTRNNFTSHLNTALCRKKIQTFIDDELERGEEISPSLLKAIEHSKISVIILSENYASSKWCLEELAKSLQCEKTVIPIFYHVDPSHVRNQTGDFGDAFAGLEKRFEDRLDVPQRWKTALKEVANLSGWTTDSKKSESVFIEEIVMDVLKRLNKMSPSDHSDLIGVEFAIKEIESLLEIGSNDVCIVGIWGIGGIGKTSISHAIFNKPLHDFEGSYFAENVREESERGGLTSMHKELLFAILGDRNANLRLTITKERLARMKVLIVFDDVTSSNQIGNLIGDPKCLGLGSRIIITSRDKQVFKTCGANQIYKLEGLLHDEALQLFSRHAFGQNEYTIKEYKELSKRMVTYAKGVSLALKVLGSSLLGKTKQEWESAVKKIERSPPKDILDVLKISFDGLDYEEKKIFLDIACFFKGKDKNLVIDVMDSCGFCTEFGLSVLINKSLVTVSYDNKITMHDLLEEMGKEIVRQESVEDGGKRSHLFHHKDIYYVLTKNKGTEAIKSICLDVSQVGEIHLAPHAFSKMPNLKYLEVYNSDYGEGFIKLYGFQDADFEFLELHYFSWPRYAWTSLPSKFHLENLVALEMPGSNIEQLGPGVKNIANLKRIDLSKSKHLLKCPDLSSAKNLETLDLEGCISLIEIHSSIQYLNKLSILNLTNCISLCNIPSGIYSKSLRKVLFTGCSNLDTVPSLSPNVEVLRLDGTAIRELSSSIENLSKLVTLSLHGCTRLESLPNNIGKLKSLEHLILNSCSRLESLPNGISELKSLKNLTLHNCSRLKSLPSGISELKSLRNLTLYGCLRLESLPSSVFSLNALQTFDLSGCSGLKIVSSFPCNIKYLSLCGSGIQELPSSIQYLSKLMSLNLTNCWSLESLPSSIGKLKSLEFLDLSGCLKLKSLPNEIGNLEALSQLYAKGTGIREVPPSIVCLNNLCQLSFEESKVQEHLGSILPLLSGLQCLSSLNLSDCCITELPSSLGQLTSLKQLDISGNKFESIPESIINLCNLFKLDLRNCDMLKSLPELPSSIHYIQAQNCWSLESLPSSIGKLKSLEFLDLSGCLKLNSLPNEIGNLEALCQLYAKGTGIREVPPSIVRLNNLCELSFEESKVQEHLGSILPLLSGLQCLRSLNLSDCCITELPSSLGQLTSLKQLDISGNKFESIPESIINLCNLFELDLRNCDMLKSLPELPSRIPTIQAQNCKSLELFSPTAKRNVNFSNCFKLDQSALEDNVKLALQNIQSIETGSFRYACFPGSSIPEWFTFRSKGSLIKPPQGWLNYERVPLCFCIVVSPRDDHEKSKKFELHCDVHFKSDSAPYQTLAPWISWRGRSSIDSDHIYFLPYSVVWPIDNEVSFQFYIGDGKGLECYEVKECGVLFYHTPKSVAEPYHKGMDWCPFHSKCMVLLE